MFLYLFSNPCCRSHFASFQGSGPSRSMSACIGGLLAQGISQYLEWLSSIFSWFFHVASNCFRFILLIDILSHADFLRCAANHWGTTLNRWVGHSQRASNAHHGWPTIPLDLRAWALSAIRVLHPSCVYPSTSTFPTFRTFRAFNIFRSPQALTEAWKLAIGPPASLC